MARTVGALWAVLDKDNQWQRNALWAENKMSKLCSEMFSFVAVKVFVKQAYWTELSLCWRGGPQGPSV